jgi:hypothetical protein
MNTLLRHRIADTHATQPGRTVRRPTPGPGRQLRGWALGLAVSALALSGSLGAAEEPVALKPTWKVGQRIVQQTKTTQTQKIAMANAATPIQQKTEQVQDYALLVERERSGGGYEIAMEILGMRMETKMGEQSILKYDSKTDSAAGDANPMSGIFKKLVGAKFKLLTKPDGEVEKVEGVQQLLESIATGMPEMVAGVVKSMFNEDMAKQMSGLPSDLPKEPVSAGYEWPVKTEMSLGPMGAIVINMKYKYTGMETRRDYQCAVLDHKGFISGKEGAGSGPLSFSGISGTTTGRTYYVPRLGTSVESFSDQKLKMAMKAMGQDAKIEMDQRVTTRMTEITGQAP